MNKSTTAMISDLLAKPILDTMSNVVVGFNIDERFVESKGFKPKAGEESDDYHIQDFIQAFADSGQPDGLQSVALGSWMDRSCVIVVISNPQFKGQLVALWNPLGVVWHYPAGYEQRFAQTEQALIGVLADYGHRI